MEELFTHVALTARPAVEAMAVLVVTYGALGAIAVIRTFLNYFLERDLEKAKEVGEPA